MANGKGRRRLGNIPSQMEKVAFLQTVRTLGGGDSITFSLQRNSHGEVGKRASVISSVVRVVPSSQTCLCVCTSSVGLNKGYI